jgi:hypothetical protein
VFIILALLLALPRPSKFTAVTAAVLTAARAAKNTAAAF